MFFQFILLTSFVSSAFNTPSFSPDTFNQVSFSGGGALGAVEIGIFKRILEIEPNYKTYDLYTGISAGALNSGFLSYFKDPQKGVTNAEKIYSGLRNHMIYALLPFTGVSVFNTQPLKDTLTSVISKMPKKPAIHTLIGATNMYSGNLDVYTFEDQSDTDKVLLMMSSSAIPGLFPPIEFKDWVYADGGTLSNELLQIERPASGQYLNITYITPHDGYSYNDDPIDSLETMLKRTASILLANYNDPLTSMYQNCKTPIGELNQFYVPTEYLDGYTMLNFDHGKELIDIGYYHMQSKKYKLC
jgi:predicted patatin/cPLA2 family phospholipase